MAKIFSFIAIWIGLSQSTAFACVCAGGSPNDHLQMADIVFAGKVIAEEKGGWRTSRIRFEWDPPFIHLAENPDEILTTFEVTTVWKGEILARTSVDNSEICGHLFRQGEEYIVYAVWARGELFTGSCLRTNELRDAGEDLTAFGAGKPPTPIPSLALKFIRAMIAVLLLLSLLGWSTWRARRKYGDLRS